MKKKLKKGQNRWVKIVALFIVAAMLLGFVAAGLIAALSGGKSVEGTYRASDGRTLTLTKNGVAQLRVPSTNQALTATYEVDGDVVRITDASMGPGNAISFRVVGNKLVVGEGSSAEAWVKQEDK